MAAEIPQVNAEPTMHFAIPFRAILELNSPMNQSLSIRWAVSALTLAISLLPLTPAAGASPGTGPSFKGPVGLQLYSLRAEFTRNVPSTIEKVKNLGFKEVELAGTYNLSPEKFKAMLDGAGLRPVSGHFPFERYKNDPEGVAREAKILGLEYAGCAWIPHEVDFDEKECRDAAQVFNSAGAVLKKHGIKFFYHCHGYEFRPFDQNSTFMDLLIKETDPSRVAFEMDVLWVVHPGQDPVAWLNKYPKRWQLLHLKDLKRGVKGDFSGKSDVTNDVALGKGQMDWPKILKAARRAGVKHYFIEDESPSVEAQIPETLKYLETVTW